MLCWLLVDSAFAQDWTLHDAVAHALAHNLELKQTALDTEGAHASLVQTRAEWGPVLSASAGASSLSTEGASSGGAAGTTGALNWSVGVSQPLPTGGTVWVGGNQDQAISGRLTGGGIADASVTSFTGVTVEQPVLDGAWGAAGAARDQALFSMQAAELSERDARERLVVDVANAYWGLVAARERARLAVRSVDIAEVQRTETKERFAEGFAGSGDVLQLERALGVARQSRVVADASAAAAERALLRQMGVPLAGAASVEPVDRPDPQPTDYDLDAALARARVRNVSWRLAELGLVSAKRELASTRSSALPDLTLSASVGLAADGGALETLGVAAEESWAAGLSLAVPLAWSGTRAQLQGGRAALGRAELAVEAAWEDLHGQVAGALESVERDRARVELAEVTLGAAQAGLTADQDLYREGRGSTRDVVRSLEALAEAQVAGLSAQIDLQASLLTLARLEGRVLEE